jgi:hypothetical protein
VVVLVRTTLVAVHQANVTGNYTVLHEIGAPDFVAKNSAADLSATFGSLRALRLDLSRAVILDPQITRAELTADKKLYIVGALALQPVPITFEMLFQAVEGISRLYGLSITPVQSLAAGASTPSSSALIRPEPQRGAARSRTKPAPRARPARPVAPDQGLTVEPRE